MLSAEQRARIPEIETEIETAIAAWTEDWEIDDEDKREIRYEIYRKHGFLDDPFREEDEEEDEAEDEWPRYYAHGHWRPRSWMRVKMEEAGMCERDFA